MWTRGRCPKRRMIIPLLLIGYGVRWWTRRVGRKLGVERCSRPETLFYPVFRTMALRLTTALLVFAGFVLTLCIVNPTDAGQDWGGAIGGYLLLWLLCLSEVAIVARRQIAAQRRAMPVAAEGAVSPRIEAEPGPPPNPANETTSNGTKEGGSSKPWAVVICVCAAIVVAGLAMSITRPDRLKTTAPEHKPDEDTSGQPTQTAIFDVPRLAKTTLPSVVMLSVRDSTGGTIQTGTGFWISSDGLLVTNFHVIRGGVSASIKPAAGAKHQSLFEFEDQEAEGVAAYSPEADLAVLKFHVEPSHFLRLAKMDEVEIGQRVVVVGNPQGLEGSVSEGIVSAKRENKTGIPLIQMTAPISPGSSGSPVIDAEGTVIGVASAYLKAANSQGLNFAVSSESVVKLIAAFKGGPLQALAAIQRGSRGELEKNSDYQKGLRALAGGDTNTAIASLLKAAAVFDDQPKLFYALGKAWSEQAAAAPIGSENTAAKKSVEALERAVELSPDFTDAWRLLADSAWRSWQTEKDFRASKRIAELAPNEPAGWNRLVNHYMKRGDLPAAARACDRLVRLKPGDAGAWGVLGMLRVKCELFQDAMPALRKSLTLEPSASDSYLSWWQLAVCLHRLRRDAEAKQAYTNAAKQRPEIVQEVLDESRITDDSRRRQGMIRDVLAFEGASVEAWSALAEASKDAGQETEYRAARAKVDLLAGPRLSRNENEIFSLLRQSGLEADAERQMRSNGIDKYQSAWWDREVFPRVENRPIHDGLKGKLEERKRLLEASQKTNGSH